MSVTFKMVEEYASKSWVASGALKSSKNVELSVEFSPSVMVSTLLLSATHRTPSSACAISMTCSNSAVLESRY
jgi:hypothetical protein